MRKLRIAYFAHTFRSDWNNGNAHFLRGLMRALGQLGHHVTCFEPASEWSIENLLLEPDGEGSVAEFDAVYSDLNLKTYAPSDVASPTALRRWRELLGAADVVILHEWNPPALAHLLLQLKRELGFRLLFHDTHHRASSSPESFATMQLGEFDGVLAFGEALRRIYLDRFGLERVWTLHEAADTTVFFPRPGEARDQDVVWIGNWGEGERAAEISEFLLAPTARLLANGTAQKAAIFGVRYPETGLEALREAGVAYQGYLPNLRAPAVYARSGLTVHIPRQQYSAVMTGIPTIRVFEALASGIPLISAPWEDTEGLFREGDFRFVRSGEEMEMWMGRLLSEPELRDEQAAQGLATVLARHTCAHRAEQLTHIMEEML